MVIKVFHTIPYLLKNEVKSFDNDWVIALQMEEVINKRSLLSKFELSYYEQTTNKADELLHKFFEA